MANRLELTYGKSQAGKTTWYLQLAEHFYTTRGLRTRVYLGDGGGETIANSGLIEEGAVEVFQFNNRDNPFSTLQLCCEAYWPEDISNPQSKLIQTKDLSPYGMFVYEGLSVGSDYMMGDKPGGLSYRAAKGEKIGQDTPYVVSEEGLKFGGNPPSHFGFVQRRIVDLIERTRGLQVPFVQWTAHERKAEDSEYQKGVFEFGPDVCGQALTTKIGAYFGNTIHLHQVTTKKKKKDAFTQKEVEILVVERRAYTRRHCDPDAQTSIKYYANNRMPMEFADEMPEYMTPPNPLKFYAILENAKGKKRMLLQGRK